jgi:hypothetical protein
MKLSDFTGLETFRMKVALVVYGVSLLDEANAQFQGGHRRAGGKMLKVAQELFLMLEKFDVEIIEMMEVGPRRTRRLLPSHPRKTSALREDA